MEIDLKIWNYIKKKSLNELIGNTFDVSELVQEIKTKQINIKLNDEEIKRSVIHLIQLATNLLYSITQSSTVKLTPYEMRELFPYINQKYDPIYFDEKKSKMITEELKAHPDYENFAVLDQSFILNVRNTQKLFEIMGNEINIHNPSLHSLHQTLADIRDELRYQEKYYFFDENGQIRNKKKRLEDFIKYIFSADYSSKMPMTHAQLWQFISVASDRAKQKIFQKTDIKETDDIDLNKVNWHAFFDEIAKYNMSKPALKIEFNLEAYQNRRIILHLPFEQALQYENMFINKLAGVSENTFSTGSRAMVALGQATKTMTVLSGLADILLKAAVFIKTFLIMPFLAVVLLIAGRHSHKNKVKVEQQQHKTFLLNSVRINELRKKIVAQQNTLDEINTTHYQGTINIKKELSTYTPKMTLVTALQSEYNPQIMKPLKARFLSKFRSFKTALKQKFTKIKPYFGPVVAGILTGAGLFVIGMFFSTAWPFLIGVGCIAALFGVLITIFRVKTDRHEKFVRNISKSSTKELSDLTHQHEQMTKLINRLKEEIVHYKAKNKKSAPPLTESSSKADTILLRQNATLRQQVAELITQRDQLLKLVPPGNVPNHIQRNATTLTVTL